MTLYLDAAVVVAALTREPLTEAARGVMADTGVTVASTWTMVESASGLAKKVRMGEIDEAELQVSLGKLDRLEAEYLPVISLDDTHMRAAMRYTSQARLGLRAGDALHVAVAASLAATLVTSDAVMASAARALGINVRLLA